MNHELQLRINYNIHMQCGIIAVSLGTGGSTGTDLYDTGTLVFENFGTCTTESRKSRYRYRYRVSATLKVGILGTGTGNGTTELLRTTTDDLQTRYRYRYRYR